ncbi:MAG: NADH-quinone oxidoreductase subunit M [Acidobacteria bacterium]|nr:NADH-quinone oxidoreductase subunit M [Acidobacteriota bacterium]
MDHLLSWLIFLPALGAAALVFVRGTSAVRGLALLVSLATLVLAVFLFLRFDPGSSDFQFVERARWIESFQVEYLLGVDGISLLLVLLTAFLTPLAVLASWTVEHHVKAFMAFLLLLETGMLGVFASLDLVLFYVFWEVMLIPMYFLIGIWGSERRIYAAIKFILYTMAGSLLMLVSILALYFLTGARTFNLLEILETVQLPYGTQVWLFWGFFIAFAIKVPLFPFHTWLPDAHTEAPTAGSVILAGVLLKMGAYGLLRFCLPLFPEVAVQWAPFISFLAIVGILYGALVSMVQPDLKRLVAYSSVSHLGFVVLGIFAFNAQGIEGATYQMLNHGISTGALFLLVGMLYDRRHTRLIRDFGGLAHSMPVYSSFFMIVTLSSIGLPGLNNFVGEFLALQGAFIADRFYGAVAASGVILAAAYMLWMYQRVHFGEVHLEENRQLRDLGKREIVILVPLVVLMVWMGLYPATFLRRMDASVEQIITRIDTLGRTYTVEKTSRPIRP